MIFMRRCLYIIHTHALTTKRLLDMKNKLCIYRPLTLYFKDRSTIRFIILNDVNTTLRRDALFHRFETDRQAFVF